MILRSWPRTVVRFSFTLAVSALPLGCAADKSDIGATTPALEGGSTPAPEGGAQPTTGPFPFVSDFGANSKRSTSSPTRAFVSGCHCSHGARFWLASVRRPSSWPSPARPSGWRASRAPSFARARWPRSCRRPDRETQATLARHATRRSMAPISASVSSNSVAARSSAMWLSLDVPVSGIIPTLIAKRNTTWAGVRWVRSTMR